MAKKKKKEGGKGKKSGGDDDGAPEIEVPKKGFSDFVGETDAKYGPPGWAHRMSTFETFVGEYHDAGATSATDATATGKTAEGAAGGGKGTVRTSGAVKMIKQMVMDEKIVELPFPMPCLSTTAYPDQPLPSTILKERDYQTVTEFADMVSHILVSPTKALAGEIESQTSMSSAESLFSPIASSSPKPLASPIAASSPGRAQRRKRVTTTSGEDRKSPERAASTRQLKRRETAG